MEKREESSKTGGLSDTRFPPRLPQTADELDLTIKLLGNRKQCELGVSARKKLIGLIGTYPSIREASLWKRTLRRICREKSGNAEMHG